MKFSSLREFAFSTFKLLLNFSHDFSNNRIKSNQSTKSMKLLWSMTKRSRKFWTIIKKTLTFWDGAKFKTFKGWYLICRILKECLLEPLFATQIKKKTVWKVLWGFSRPSRTRRKTLYRFQTHKSFMSKQLRLCILHKYFVYLLRIHNNIKSDNYVITDRRDTTFSKHNPILTQELSSTTN